MRRRPNENLFPARDASGTSWLPDQTPMHAGHARAGSWELMWHGTAFLQFINESAPEHRGAHQTGSINWVMGMARRRAGAGRVGVRTMLSVEPWTIRGCGYPDLLATGETCDGDTIHDRQHPHDLFMELALEYERPLGRGLRWFVYGGPAGEPALGPVAFPHRVSAMSNPIAPIAHHWLDATHITFGVVTTGAFADRATGMSRRRPSTAASRTRIARTSISARSTRTPARFSVAPTATTVLQVSAGRLNDAEREAGLPPNDVTRVTASATYHRALSSSTLWASTIAWGMNDEPIDTTHALLVESAISLRDRHVGFLRWELVGKARARSARARVHRRLHRRQRFSWDTAHYLRPGHGVQIGFGGSVSGSFVPAYLAPRYGGRVAPGVAVFLTLRPAAHAM